jgi:hypothetical protein
MENALTELARAEKSRLDAELPSIAARRAMLRTRLAEMSSGRPSFFAGYRLFDFPAGALGMAALAAVLVAACVLPFRHSNGPGPGLSLLPPDRGILPNRALTPGAVRQVSLEEVCSLQHEEVVKAVSPAERERVFAEYGISGARSDRYEVDYLITPGLGGDDDIRNLWPEPYEPEKWNAHVKDVLEERLHELVCSHQLDLPVAQEAIATNWIAAYEKYVQPANSNMQRDGTAPVATTARSIAGFFGLRREPGSVENPILDSRSRSKRLALAGLSVENAVCDASFAFPIRRLSWPGCSRSMPFAEPFSEYGGGSTGRLNRRGRGDPGQGG